jgi:hypothetical protein
MSPRRERYHRPALALAAGAAAVLLACRHDSRPSAGGSAGGPAGGPQAAGQGNAVAGGAAGDTAFAALQERGRAAMGVDQYTSTHRFESLPDGGRIELQRDTDDPEGVAVIRRHLRDIQHAFAEGDFTTPAFVHMRDVPGARVMAAKRAMISYRYADLPRGGELRIKSSDPEAVVAVHEFLAFQRREHHTRGGSTGGGATTD